MSKMNNSDKILNDIRTYLRLSAAVAARSSAAKVFDTQEKAKVYEKLYEGASQAKIEGDTGVPQRTISDWVNEFVEAGLVTPPSEYSKNYKALFTLRELAVNTSDLAKRKTRQQTEEVKKLNNSGQN